VIKLHVRARIRRRRRNLAPGFRVRTARLFCAGTVVAEEKIGSSCGEELVVVSAAALHGASAEDLDEQGGFQAAVARA
jgi:hypothetical protein